MSPQPRLLLLGAVLALGACADPEDRSTDFNYLHATIIEPSCATVGCHSASVRNGGPCNFEVDLSSPRSACCALASDTREKQEACEADGEVDGDWVTPDGAQIPLLQLLRGEASAVRNACPDGPPENVQMPIDSPLTPAEIALIEQWIEDGAECE